MKASRTVGASALAASAVVAISALIAGGAPAGTAPRCHGEPATIVRGPGDNTIVGTPRADVIIAGGGSDSVKGRRGGDTACGGRGKDFMQGGRGKDRFDGKKGTDTVLGGASKDRVTGGRGNDGSRGALLDSPAQTAAVGTLGLPPGRIDGQSGEDKEFGGPGDDTLYGTGDGEKRDLLDGGRGNADECLADNADRLRRCEPIPD